MLKSEVEFYSGKVKVVIVFQKSFDIPIGWYIQRFSPGRSKYKRFQHIPRTLPGYQNKKESSSRQKFYSFAVVFFFLLPLLLMFTLLLFLHHLSLFISFLSFSPLIFYVVWILLDADALQRNSCSTFFGYVHI